MPNRLAQEASPYLLQHADNPVDWYPWCEAAFEAARHEDKPILLSIGYSACHWCHVMAHESFEDDATAALMNARFINIKVDREERPDLDQIYQSAHQLLTERSGGWPLTVFLTPEGVPFLSGTYFPKTQRYGLPSFSDLLQYVSDAYLKQRDEITAQNQRVLAGLARSLPSGAAHHSDFSAAPLDAAFTMLEANFDSRNGGFGGAPKFPHPTDLAFLLRRHARTEAPRARAMALLSLNRMAAGGLFDQIGGGFYRYSVDAEWNIPHFEKMLYDNGPLLRLYSDAFALTGEAEYQRVVEATAGWVMREMQSPEGGFYAALDADSEGEEGKFYVWTQQQMREALTEEEYALVSRHFGLTRGANFEGAHWHCYVAESLWQIASSVQLDNETAQARLQAARDKLFAVRQTRVRPGLDDKILTSWNAQMIEGLARASAVFGRADWLASARKALTFIRQNLWANDRLLAVAKGRSGRLNAYLDDYAFLLSALIELLQTDFHADDLSWAEDIADALLDHFEDRSAGGFFFTSHDHETLIARTKPGFDNAQPAGNSVAAFALQRLGWITGEKRYLDAAERTLRLFYPQLQANPSGFASLSLALMEHQQPPRLVILRGAAATLAPWQAQLSARFAPDTLVFNLGEARSGLPPVLDKPLGPHAQAWVCQGTSCQPPLSDWNDICAALS